VLARDATTQGVLVLQSMGLRMVCQTHADVVKEATSQKPTYVCTEERIVVCRPDLCTVKRAARAGLLMLANKGAVAEASKATCSCTFIVKIVQWSSPVFTDSPT